MADALQVTVRFLHILFGVVWVGGALFFGHAVAGGLAKQPPQVRGPAMLSVMGKAMTLFMVAGPATVLFGVWNQYLMVGALSYQGTVWNVSLGAALVVSLVMLGIAFGVQFPTFRRLKALVTASAGGPPPAEADALRKRLMIGGFTIIGLGLVALFLMVLATAQRVVPRVV